MKQAAGLVLWLLVTYAAAGLGGAVTASSVGDWYATLQKPPWNPPGWVFGPVWTALYTMMAVAAWLVWRERGFAGAGIALGLWLLQLALNVAWSWLFFGQRNPGLALLDLGLLCAAVLATTLAFWPISRLAGALLIPYLAWASFAAVLNFTIWRLNPPT